MNWQLFWTIFGTIFLAELGDKTQLGVFSFTSSSKSPMTVFIAASCGLVAVTFVGVLAGGIITKFIDEKFLKIGSGVLFILIGLWTIFKGG